MVSSTSGGRVADRGSLRYDPDYVLEGSKITDEKTVAVESRDYIFEESDMTDEKNISTESSALTIEMPLTTNVGDLIPPNVEDKGKIPYFSEKSTSTKSSNFQKLNENI